MSIMYGLITIYYVWSSICSIFELPHIIIKMYKTILTSTRVVVQIQSSYTPIILVKLLAGCQVWGKGPAGRETDGRPTGTSSLAPSLRQGDVSALSSGSTARKYSVCNHLARTCIYHSK